MLMRKINNIVIVYQSKKKIYEQKSSGTCRLFYSKLMKLKISRNLNPKFNFVDNNSLHFTDYVLNIDVYFQHAGTYLNRIFR